MLSPLIAETLLPKADDPSGPLYEFMGLPVHPLVVHIAVVFLPLAALGLIAIFAIPALRRRIGWLVMIGLVVGVGGVYVAKESGERLAAVIGLPERHAELAEQVTVMAFVLLGIGFLWYLVARLGDRKQAKMAASRAQANAVGSGELGATELGSAGTGAAGSGAAGSGAAESAPTRSRQSVLALILGMAMVIVALLNLVWIVLVGHSGAEAVWAGTLPQSGGVSVAPSASPSASPSEDETATSYSMADVAAHATVEDCWSAVDGNVYNLTSWADKHPGGATAIASLCGKDASSAFRGQHGSEAEPNEVLSGFAIGVLAAGSGSVSEQPSEEATPGATATAATAAVASPKASSGVYTIAEVKTHRSKADCWAVVDNNVYDLTKWGDKHPGGAAKIYRLCGKDATEEFREEHAKEREPNSVLAGYQIGTLAGFAN